jgi:hypothetical protein
MHKMMIPMPPTGSLYRAQGTSKNIGISNRVVAVRMFKRKTRLVTTCSNVWRLTNELAVYVPFLRSVNFWMN